MQAEQPVSPIDIPQVAQQSTADINVVPQSTVSPATTTIAPPETIASPPTTSAPSTADASSDADPQMQTVSTAAPEGSSNDVGTANTQEAAIAKQRQRLEQQLADIVARDRAVQVEQPPVVELTPEVVAPTPVTVSPFPSSEQVEVRLEPRTPPTTRPYPNFAPNDRFPQGQTNVQPLPQPPALSNWNSIDIGASGDVGTGVSNITPQVTYQPATNPAPGQMILPPAGGANRPGLIYPLASPAPITSPYGWRIHPISGDSRLHKGVDYGAPTGTPILAAARGRVDIAGELSGYGSTVVIRHNNDTLETLYGHMSQILVKEGQWVEQGTVIGLVGSTGYSTGPHLHFEVLQSTSDGWVAIDPVPQINQSVALQNVPMIQPATTTGQTATALQGTVPGQQMTVTTLQPIAVSNPSIATPNLMTMSIGLNGVVTTPDPVTNLMSLGNRLVSFENNPNSPSVINSVGVLAPLAFSPPITPKLSALIPPLHQPTVSAPAPVPAVANPQITSQEWVTFPPPASLIPEDSQSATAMPAPGTTTASTLSSTATGSQPINTTSSPALSSDRTQASNHSPTAWKSTLRTIAAKATVPVKPAQVQAAQRASVQGPKQVMNRAKTQSPPTP
ncbi:peptidoglycan DD-metalloendopeptidase family protein [Pantanalinema sp. GBBB05]|uniref:M23 family metallopeptidase n=1 Tax=Pantanalinema sp. GBBB05 TaxID=2604139 RepID=UPI003D819FA0